MKNTCIAVFIWGFSALLSFAGNKSPESYIAPQHPPSHKKISHSPLNPKVSSRIVGGSVTPTGAWPWMVALVEGYKSPSQGQFCGGSLIHPYWVLTAAHCVEGEVAHNIDVVAGINNLNQNPVERLQVAEIIQHPQYNPFTLENDLALLRLQDPSTHPTISTIRIIDHENLDNPGVTSTVIGWGSTTGDGATPSAQLRQVNLPIVSLAIANAPIAHNGFLTPEMLPAGFAAGAKDSCQGDSGGPLIVPDGNGAYVLAGVVSFGKLGSECADPNAYGVYTRIASYRNFILQHVWPSYANYESTHLLTSERDDLENDGLNNWQEFAFNLDPNIDEPEKLPSASSTTNYPSISMRQHRSAPEVQYQTSYATQVAGPFLPLDLQANEISRIPISSNPAMDLVTIRGPQTLQEAPFGLFHTEVSQSENYAPGVRQVGKIAHLKHRLETHDTLRSNRFEKIYALELTQGTPQTLALRSSSFDAHLEIINADTKTTVATDPSNSGNGQDDKITFTPSPGINYQARVTSTTTNQTGPFSFRSNTAFSTPASNLNSPQTLLSILDVSDPIDPNFNDNYYFESYLLNLPINQEIQIQVTSSQFDTYLYLYDPETGETLAFNDDGILSGGSLSLNSKLRYKKTSHAPVQVIVSSSVPLSTGIYTLSATSVTRPTVTPTLPAVGSLATTDPLDPSFLPNALYYYYDDLDLGGFSEGDSVTVTLANFNNFDSYIYLIDTTTNRQLDFNDDGPFGTVTSVITFTAKRYARYAIRISSYDPEETGTYQIGVTLN